MSTELIPLLLHQSQAAQERAVVQTFEHAGAIPPATAVPLAELPAIDAALLQTLVIRGTVREAAPGTFYRFATPRVTGRAWWVRIVAFWLIVLLVPLLFLWLTNRQ